MSDFKPTHVLIIILLLIPSAAFLWHNSDLPQFGDFHDDGLYFVSAKSLASGNYRIESLPTEPYQTKYPPLYPLLLSIAWRMDPHFPANLRLAAWISWIALPILFVLLAELYPRFGITGWRKWLLMTALAVNPYVILFSSKLLTELWFTALLFTAMLLIEQAARGKASTVLAAAGGIIGGVAYLTRASGVVLLLAGFVYLWLRHNRRNAIVFAATMFPFLVCWMAWVRLHAYHGADPALVYYTDYFRYELYNITPKTLHLFLWKNLDGLVSSLGYLVLPRYQAIPEIGSSTLLKILAEVVGVASISGVVRMARAGRALLYIIFAAGSAFLLLIWHFPPDERLILPLMPLAFAGLFRELEHFVALLRSGWQRPELSQKIASMLIVTLVAAILIAAIGLQAYVDGDFSKSVEAIRERNIDFRGTYAWIRSNLPADASVVAYNDPAMYLYTGRRSIRRILPFYLWYTSDHVALVDLYRELAPYAKDHGADFAYHTTNAEVGMTEDDALVIDHEINTNPLLIPIYSTGIGTVYRVDAEARERPKTAYTAPPAATITSPGQVVAGR